MMLGKNGSLIQTFHMPKLIVFCVLLVGACNLPDFTEVQGPDVSYVAVATGDLHACGLTSGGEVYCWSSADRRPESVPTSLRFESLSTFAGHACALKSDGEAYCWGANDMGQLGTSSAMPACRTTYAGLNAFCSTTPVQVETDLTFEEVSVGAAHSCALDSDGNAYCWGLNSWGQLGHQSDTLCALDLLPEGLPCTLTPKLVEGGLRFTTLSAGQSHNCALTLDGTAYCWGAGSSGRLGDGLLESQDEPSPVAGGFRFSSISAGGNHTCAIVEGGEAYCWGANAGMQLGTTVEDFECGIRLTACVSTPHRVETDLRFNTISSSATVYRTGTQVIGGHTCGIATDGEVYCWGLNEDGQLGGHSDFTSSEPVSLKLSHRFLQIDAGTSNTCGVTFGRTMHCWHYGTPLTWWRVFEPSETN